MNLFFTIITAAIIFGILIIAHEFGHFIVAIKSGVKVLEFSIGMGPVLYQRETKTTKYSIRLFIPIGGFCQMKGEDDEEDKPEKGSFNYASPFKRIAILSAGAIMNLIVALLIFILIFINVGTDPSTKIETVVDNSPAYNAGMMDGDNILSINGTEVESWDNITDLIVGSDGKTLNVKVERTVDGQTIQTDLEIQPEIDTDSGEYKIGIITQMKVDFFHTITYSFRAIGQYIVLIFMVFGGLFSGQFRMDEVFSGPIGITAEIGRQLSTNGMLPILNIAAAMAVSLAFFNLLPLPALDGGRIFFTLIEAIKGSPVSRKVESRVHYIGFLLLMLLAIYIAFNDILKLF